VCRTYNHGWYNTVGETTYFYQSVFDVPLMMQQQGECIEMLKKENRRLEEVLALRDRNTEKIDRSQQWREEKEESGSTVEVETEKKVKKKKQKKQKKERQQKSAEKEADWTVVEGNRKKVKVAKTTKPIESKNACDVLANDDEDELDSMYDDTVTIVKPVDFNRSHNKDSTFPRLGPRTNLSGSNDKKKIAEEMNNEYGCDVSEEFIKKQDEFNKNEKIEVLYDIVEIVKECINDKYDIVDVEVKERMRNLVNSPKEEDQKLIQKYEDVLNKNKLAKVEGEKFVVSFESIMKMTDLELHEKMVMWLKRRSIDLVVPIHCALESSGQIPKGIYDPNMARNMHD